MSAFQVDVSVFQVSERSKRIPSDKNGPVYPLTIYGPFSCHPSYPAYTSTLSYPAPLPSLLPTLPLASYDSALLPVFPLASYDSALLPV